MPTDPRYLPLVPPINETGKKYGRLTVLEYYVSPHDRSGGRWLCQCECGFQFIVRGRDLRRGRG